MNKPIIAIRVLKEMELNYKTQYPKEIPDMNLVINLILDEIVYEVYGTEKL